MATSDSNFSNRIGDPNAPALQAIFVKADGHAGASEDSAFSGQIEALNVTWHADQQATPGVGGQLNVGKANVGALKVTAYMNKETASLTQALLQAKVIPSIEVNFCRVANGRSEAYGIVKLKNAIATSIDYEGSINSPRMLYSIAFSGTNLNIETKAQTKSGSMAAGSTCTHDILKNSA